MACDSSARKIAWRTVGIIKRQIPVSFLVVDQLTGNNLIIEPANLRKRILIEDSYGFTLPFPKLGK